jgi:hypothetical protein
VAMLELLSLLWFTPENRCCRILKHAYGMAGDHMQLAG